MFDPQKRPYKNKWGIFLNNTATSQLAYTAIRDANQALHDGVIDDCILFYENVAPFVLQPNFASMPSCNAYPFDGKLVATDIGTAQKILICTSPAKIFYVWDLEWLRGYNYSYLVNFYRNEQLKLVTRSDEYAALIKNCWNREASVMSFYEMLRNYEN